MTGQLTYGTMAFMKNVLQSGKWLVMLAVISSLVASAVTFIWGMAHLASKVKGFVADLMGGHPAEFTGVEMIAVVDTFLLGTVLYIFAVGLYELFFGELDVPAWLVINHIDDLKDKLIGVIFLIMVVTFLKHLVKWEHSQDTLFFALAIAAISLGFLAYSNLKSKKSH